MQNNKIKLEKILFGTIENCYVMGNLCNTYQRDPTEEKKPSDENGKIVKYLNMCL